MQAETLRVGAWRGYAPCITLPGMAGRFLKEWRKYRGLTLEQVAGRLLDLDDPHVPATPASLSRIETGKQSYTERSLEALANVYECDAADLIGVDPFKRDELDEAMKRLSVRNEFTRRRIARLIQAMEAEETEEERKLA